MIFFFCGHWERRDISNLSFNPHEPVSFVYLCFPILLSLFPFIFFVVLPCWWEDLFWWRLLEEGPKASSDRNMWHGEVVWEEGKDVTVWCRRWRVGIAPSKKWAVWDVSEDEGAGVGNLPSRNGSESFVIPKWHEWSLWLPCWWQWTDRPTRRLYWQKCRLAVHYKSSYSSFLPPTLGNDDPVH